mmetsp:Transcript_10485/g.34626  ORF Transcript_10485/g.34626 Transcript_10485/m.34626 type:complete len:343 (+) Transcript_10485:766-1794(+)
MPLGLAAHVPAKSLAFDHVFRAMARAVLLGEEETVVTTPWLTKLTLRFERRGDDVRRDHLVSAAMNFHKGRAAKFDAFQRRLGLKVYERPSTTTPEKKQGSQPPLLNYTDFVEYFSTIARSKFFLSPVGTGIDCFRHWETLLLGAVPVVDYSPVAAGLFEKLPVLLLRNWNDPISHADFDRFYDDHVLYGDVRFDLKRLTNDHWRTVLTNFLDHAQTHTTEKEEKRKKWHHLGTDDGGKGQQQPSCDGPPFVAVCDQRRPRGHQTTTTRRGLRDDDQGRGGVGQLFFPTKKQPQRSANSSAGEKSDHHQDHHHQEGPIRDTQDCISAHLAPRLGDLASSVRS